jgi:hypothetical protein
MRKTLHLHLIVSDFAIKSIDLSHLKKKKGKFVTCRTSIKIPYTTKEHKGLHLVVDHAMKEFIQQVFRFVSIKK